MINLWLDDVRDPDDPPIQELFGAVEGMVWVKTAEAAIARLKSVDVAWVSLDHDLGTRATGYDVCLWMEERAYSGELARVSWTIHSANVEGARRMRAALQKADEFWARWERGSSDSE